MLVIKYTNYTLIPNRMPEERFRDEAALINLAASSGESSLGNES